MDEDYIKNRAYELVKDKHHNQLLYMIGGYHEINKETVDKDKKKIYFIRHIIEYLSYEQE